ncbi:phage tail sheath protein [Paenibacillus sp. CAA11]|uniref:phage tail sheath family protein n=1 Tax=Paenibacillus sp. CAA11 TaxID=1532905 RepID=UPI000D3D7D01|nr:phage tail sheath family protein [Paenibacillus sp. CAA11]AWB45322.1 phage tail sheath protein [Paenibacillus sp. CAA11]
MAGGTWNQMDEKLLPGLYMNFQAAAASAIQPGARGTVVVPVKADWGPVREFVEISSEQGIRQAFGAQISEKATAASSLYLALLGGPKKLFAYRLADASAKVAELKLKSKDDKDLLLLSAKYPGARGNSFRMTVQPSVTDPAVKEIKLYEGTALLRTFNAGSGSAEAAREAINGDSENVWVTAQAAADAADSTLAEIASAAFAGGASGIDSLTNADYIAAQAALETQSFDVLALDGVTDSALQQSFAAWTKRVRQEGKQVLLVLGGSLADDTAAKAPALASARSALLNHEGIINVGTGARLNGTDYSSAQISAYVAGLIAGQRLNESTTYAVTPFEDVTRRWTRTEQEDAVRGGVFILFHDGRQVKVLRGMNSLITPRSGQNKGWSKIRTVRVMDAITSDLQRSAEETYIGRVNNTEEGRLALIGACKAYLAQLAGSGVIEANGYDVTLDPAYYGPGASLTPQPDQVYLQWNARLTDVMEQLFGTFYVQ